MAFFLQTGTRIGKAELAPRLPPPTDDHRMGARNDGIQRMSAHAQMFDDIDRMDADGWASHLAPDAVMRFGNADPVHGREACRDALAAFYGQIQGLAHHVLEQ